MSEIHYRPAVESDFPALAAMYARLNAYFSEVGYRLPHPENVGEVWLESFRRTLGRFSQVFVAEMDDEVIGFILCRVKRVPAHMGGVLVGEISDVWVEERSRRLGVGAHLVRMGVEWLRERDVHSVEVQVLRDNIASQNLFDSLGFQVEFRVSRLLWDDYQP